MPKTQVSHKEYSYYTFERNECIFRASYKVCAHMKTSNGEILNLLFDANVGCE